MKEIKLEYVGRGFSGDRMYKDTEGTYFEKDDYNDIIYIGKDPDNDPWGSVKNIEKYKDATFITTGDEDLPTEAERFNYMMLGRLESDCKYYLGNGNRYAGHLWTKNEQEQINKMKEIYNSFTDDKKPEWLTLEQIAEYENAMITG